MICPSNCEATGPLGVSLAEAPSPSAGCVASARRHAKGSVAEADDGQADAIAAPARKMRRFMPAKSRSPAAEGWKSAKRAAALPARPAERLHDWSTVSPSLRTNTPLSFSPPRPVMSKRNHKGALDYRPKSSVGWRYPESIPPGDREAAQSRPANWD